MCREAERGCTQTATTSSNVTYIDVPHEVCGGQGEVDVLRQRELLSDPPSREHGGGLGVLGESHMQEEAVNKELYRSSGLQYNTITLLKHYGRTTYILK